MPPHGHPVAIITGGSRGIGAATVRALARRGFDVALTYRNKAARAESVAAEARAVGVEALPLAADLTRQADIQDLYRNLAAWRDRIDVLVLNASGGLERDLIAADPEYPTRINRDAQVALVEALRPMMGSGSTVVFVTSHWAHLYGRTQQLPAYETVARTKWAGEQALRAQQEDLAAQGIRLVVVTGDLIEGTITPKLLERAGPGMTAQRKATLGRLPTADDMGEAIAAAATDSGPSSGHTVVVGGALDTLL
jgi:NAD(P)-dependent dehydrogenase (short-subunit alcohol dehydrogenase family)